MNNTELEPKTKIYIDLANSSNAKSFKSDNVIHQDALKKVKEFIDQFIEANKIALAERPLKKKGKIELSYKHNTITILGTRGSGKTSFLLSIKELITNNKEQQYDDLLFLDMIDPTLVEEKGHVFLNIISSICDEVKTVLAKEEANKSDDVECTRKHWKEAMNKLAKGLPSIDGIGNGKFGEWQDAEFVMQNELQAIHSARNLAKYFAEFVEQSLKILDKKQFVLFFDDIDVDSSKGYAVLETIRKYFVTDQLISFLSGDLKLYDALVRDKKWNNFGSKLITFETSQDFQEKTRRIVNMNHYNDMVTDLTSQYLIKIMQPKYRVHLSTLYDYYINKETGVFIANKNDDQNKKQTPKKLKKFLKQLFKIYGIKSNLQRTAFVEFLLHQPLRSVLHFLQYFEGANNKETTDINTDFTSVFLSDLYEKHVDINTLQNSVTYFLPTILQVLIQEQRLRESYQLIPSTLDNSFNATLFTSSLLFSNHINKNHKFLIFEYFFKIAFLRNFIDRENDYELIKAITKTSGLLTDNIFRDSCNQLQSSLFGQFGNKKEVNEFGMLLLYGLAKIAKQNTSEKIFRIDYILENGREDVKCNQLQSYLGYLPCFIGQSSTKNASKLFYSVLSLLSSIGELIRRYNEESLTKENFLSVLAELGQLRYYTTSENEEVSKTFTTEKKDKSFEEEEFDTGYELENDFFIENNINEFYDILEQWFDKDLKAVSPYMLGKIFTRFYYSLNRIGIDKSINLGQSFHLQIVAFMNAVIIEEARELEIVVNLNNDNIVSSDKAFINNIHHITQSDKKDQMKFSMWMLSCPLLLIYTKNRIRLKVRDFVSQTEFSNGLLSDKLYNDLYIGNILDYVYLEGGKGERPLLDKYENLYQKIKCELLHDNKYLNFKRKRYVSKAIEMFLDEFPIAQSKLKQNEQKDFVIYAVKRCGEDIIDEDLCSEYSANETQPNENDPNINSDNATANIDHTLVGDDKIVENEDTTTNGDDTIGNEDSTTENEVTANGDDTIGDEDSTTENEVTANDDDTKGDEDTTTNSDDTIGDEDSTTENEVTANDDDTIGDDDLSSEK
ncbi:hypothetical protein [Myroides sp. DW712]|uniref:hypothetical protein n=1 Tax=Myroides sp. DW712 TaxID=3389800 RepID=UPI0039791167